jgi:hypothetical protein
VIVLTGVSMPTSREICVRMRVCKWSQYSAFAAGDRFRIRPEEVVHLQGTVCVYGVTNLRSEAVVTSPKLLPDIPRTGTRTVHAVCRLLRRRTVAETRLTHEMIFS